jgi:hypothetical protein
MEKFEKAYTELLGSIEERYKIELTDAERNVIKQGLIHFQRKKGKSLTDFVEDFTKKSVEYMWLRQYKVYAPDLSKCKPDSKYYEYVRKTRESFIHP